MSKNKFQISKHHQEEGVTLVIAIIMLASVIFISFSISTVILRELGAARLLLRTEPAIISADAGTEVGLYQFFQQTGNVNPSGSLQQSGASYQVTTTLYDNPYGFSISSGNTARILLYDAANPNNVAANYGSVTIQNFNSPLSNPIKVDIYSLGDLSTTVCSQNIGVNQQYTCSALNSADDRYLIVITPNGNAAASGQITTTDNGGQPKGVPSNKPQLQSTGTNLDVQRRLLINLTGP